jgi:hypothetical protein
VKSNKLNVQNKTELEPVTTANTETVSTMQKRVKDENEFESGFSLKMFIDDAINCSTIHCIGNIYRSKSSILRICLIVVFLACIGYCIYQLVNTIIAFLAYSVITATTTYNEAPAEFPVVMYCSLNSYDYNYARKAVHEFTDDGTIDKANFSNMADYLEEVDEHFRFNLIKKYIKNPRVLGSDFGFLIDQTLMSCRFQNKPCGYKDFMQW